jgi:Ca-activated chloride channel homolog
MLVSGQFDQAFQEAEKVIYGRQLAESDDTGDYTLIQATLRMGGWTVLLTFGITLALLLGQNYYVRCRQGTFKGLLTIKESIIIIVGSLVAGLIAGSMGQLLFTSISKIPNYYYITLGLNGTLFGLIITTFLGKFKKNKFNLFILGQVIISGLIEISLFVYLSTKIGDLFANLIASIIFGIIIANLFSSKNIGWLIGFATLFLNHWLMFPIPGFPSSLQLLARILGWTTLGSLLALGITFIPNLKRLRALIGGSLGGSLGSFGFLITTIFFTDIPSRLIGAIILGFCIGMMIFWEEVKQLQTDVHLIVHWTINEQTQLLLGKSAIIVGTSLDAQIPLNKTDGYFPITAKFFKEGDEIFIEYDLEYARAKGMKKWKHPLRRGDRRKFGKIAIEVSQNNFLSS